MKLTTAIAAATMAIAAPASAERFVLSNDGYWETALNVEADTNFAFCSTGNLNDSMSFRMTVTDSGGYWIFINDFATRDMQFIEAFDMRLQIEGKDPVTWTLTDAEVEADSSGVVISFSFASDFERSEFFVDMIANDSVKLLGLDTDEALAGWSLYGSASAIAALEECGSMILKGNV